MRTAAASPWLPQERLLLLSANKARKPKKRRAFYYTARSRAQNIRQQRSWEKLDSTSVAAPDPGAWPQPAAAAAGPRCWTGCPRRRPSTWTARPPAGSQPLRYSGRDDDRADSSCHSSSSSFFLFLPSPPSSPASTHVNRQPLAALAKARACPAPRLGQLADQCRR